LLFAGLIMKIFRDFLIVAFVFCVTSFSALPYGMAAWQPKKPVQIWVTFGRGAHADLWARKITSLIAKHNLSPVAFQVVNIPTGAGVVAFPKFGKLVREDHTLMLVLPNVFTIPLFKKNVPFDIEKMTPIAMMGEEPLALWVKSDRAEIRTIGDLVRVARARGKKFKMTGPPLGTPRAMLVEMIASMYDLDITYIGVRRIGSTAKLLAKENFDATIHNPSEQVALTDPYVNRPIAILSTGRLREFLTIPTLRETGMAITYNPSRTVIGPPKMTEGARLFYSALFQKVFETPEWQKIRKDRGHIGKFLTGAELASYLSRRAVKHVRWKMAIEQLRVH